MAKLRASAAALLDSLAGLFRTLGLLFLALLVFLLFPLLSLLAILRLVRLLPKVMKNGPLFLKF